METVVDTNNLEYTYSLGSYSGSANSLGAGLGNNNWTGWTQTTAMSGISYRDQRIGDLINLFEKEVKENITDPNGQKKGYISLKLGYRGQSENWVYPIVSIVTLCIPNFLGFPFEHISQTLEVQVEIWNKNKDLIKKYTENVEDDEYLAMYWGYGEDTINRKLAADNIKNALEKIRKRIEIDANEINKKLHR